MKGKFAVIATVLACLGCSLAIAVNANAAASNSVATETTSSTPDAPTPTPGYTVSANDGSGVAPGKIKHIWMIVLENTTYQSAFTGLNGNSYLAKTLPDQGALLENYYGTGHSSLDNYLSLASGQAPVTDDQANCPAYDNLTGTMVTSGVNNGQLASAAGPEAASGKNGCVYPASVPTIFNQLDGAGKTWKVYNQDMGGTSGSLDAPGDPRHSVGTQYCGAPDTSAAATGTASSTANNNVNPTGEGSVNPANPNGADMYVAKHSPLPFFQSVLQSGDCASTSHLSDLFDPNTGLYHDLQGSADSVPAFNWIDPNLCSDAHDAVCNGNNGSGGWKDANTMNPPTNYTGGLYASDIFLQHIIPEIEASKAFSDGGLIDITFDEAYPEFTWSNSFVNSTLDRSTAADMLRETASAGETLYGRGVATEPQGPNTPLIWGVNGQALSAGAGYNRIVDRPTATDITAGSPLVPCTATGDPTQGQCFLGGGGGANGYTGNRASATQAGATAAAGSSTIADNAINVNDEGRAVTGTGIPTGAYVGQVADAYSPSTSPQTVTTAGAGSPYQGSFTLVDSTGTPLATTAAVSGITLAGESDATDPLYDAYDGTPGGGRTGDVLISPYIKPGTVSQVDYNHYSALRSFEDLLGINTGGVDGQGHIGFAAQTGLAPFGSDVFTNATTPPAATTVTQTVTTTKTSPTQTSTTYLPGSIFTVTTPGGTRKIAVAASYVPKLFGDTVAEAKAALNTQKLVLGKVRSPKVKRGYSLLVKSQSIGAGKAAVKGAKVNLTLALFKDKR